MQGASRIPKTNKNNFFMEINPFAQILQELAELKKLLTEKPSKTSDSVCEPKPEADIINVADACKLLNISKSTLYGKVHRKEIPHYKHGKLLQFSKSEIIELIKSKRQKTAEEIKEDAGNCLVRKRKN